MRHLYVHGHLNSNLGYPWYIHCRYCGSVWATDGEPIPSQCPECNKSGAPVWWTRNHDEISVSWDDISDLKRRNSDLEDRVATLERNIQVLWDR